MKKQTAVEWLYEVFYGTETFNQKEVLKKAKEMEHKEQEELLKWAHTMFTKDAPLDYVLSEFNKLKNK